MLVVYDFTHMSYKILYQQSPYTHFVHTDSIKIFDINSQEYKEFISLNDEQQQQELLSKQNEQQQQQNMNISSLPSSPVNTDSSSSTLITNLTDKMIKDAIQSLLGNNVYNNGINSISAINQKIDTTITATNTSVLDSYIFNTSTSNNNNSNIDTNIHKPVWFVGRVFHKEFCIAKKENNRYRVPSGTRFYRVKVKPFKI